MKRSKTTSRSAALWDRRPLVRSSNQVRRRSSLILVESLEERMLLSATPETAYGVISSSIAQGAAVTSTITGLQPVQPLGSLVYETFD